MKAAEKNLLLAVRNQLRTAVVSGGAGYTDAQCNVEADGDAIVPGTVADLYVVVMPTSWRPGPRHQSSGTVRDLIYGVAVRVVKRITAVPRDRTRDAFALQSASLNGELDKIFMAVDWSQTVRSAANTLITAETGSTEGFTHPLTFSGMDAKPQFVNSGVFGGEKENRAGLARTIRFDNARRITTI